MKNEYPLFGKEAKNKTKQKKQKKHCQTKGQNSCSFREWDLKAYVLSSRS